MKRGTYVSIALVAALGTAVVLVQAWVRGYCGFPLDDAWIHQTYARNLVEYGQWAFVPGQPSAGSTAPLWTGLVALGYALGAPHREWTYALGTLCLAGTAWIASGLARRLFPQHRAVALLAGLACALEWHLVWAAASGMETLLFALLALAVWYRSVGEPGRRPLVTGLLGGALILTRPEGVLLAGLAALPPLLAEAKRGSRLRGLIQGATVVAGSLLLVTPYLLLNLRLSGTVWPNTFYAKQAEYAVYRLQPLVVRLWGRGNTPGVATAPLVGGQALLVPGLLWGLGHAARRFRTSLSGREATWWLPLCWALAVVAVYAVRLPVTYQHGRYLIPIIPVVLVYGVGGTLDLARAGRRGILTRAGTRSLLIAAGLLFVGFWLLRGGPQYATDVAIIEEEMVATARWLDSHTERDALIAAHDIGAIGYFTQRPLLDMAGLVSPEVIPFIRDEEALLDWLRDRDADYLVAFPSWYETITANPQMEELFRTRAAVTVEQGGENMVVYAAHWDRQR